MWLFRRKCKNHKLKWIGFTEEGDCYPIYKCEICDKTFIRLHDGRLI